MAQLNRFYQQSGSKYQSQFVPEKLPTDLMAKALYSKQNKANQMGAAAAKLGELEFAALPEHDALYVKEWKQRLEKFSQDSLTEDKTSPDYIRRYHALLNEVQTDEGIQQAAASVKKDQEHRAHIKKLKEQGDNDYAEVLDLDYQYTYNNYTRKGGEGFTGDPLGDPIIQKGVNVFKNGLEFFTPLKEDGGDSIKFLDSGISYKDGWVGTSDNKVLAQADRQYDLWAETDGAKQLRTKELADLGYVQTTYNKLSTKERKRIDGILESTMKNNFIDIGRTVVHGKSDTNRDVALRSQFGYDKEDGKLSPTITTTSKVAQHDPSAEGETLDKQIQDLSANIKAIDKALAANEKDQILTPKNAEAYKAKKALYTEMLYKKKQKKNENWRETAAETFDELGPQKFKDIVTGLNFRENGGDGFETFEAVANQLKDEDLKKELLNLVEMFPYTEEDVKELALTSKKRSSNDIKKMRLIEKALATATPGSNTDVVGQQLRIILDKKQQAIEEVSSAITTNWNKKFYERGKKGTAMAITQATAPSTGKYSVANQFSQDVVSNPTGYTFMNSQGDIISHEELGGRIESFSTTGFTVGQAANSDNFGAVGSVTLVRPLRNADGEIQYDEDTNVLKTEKVTMAMTAVPNGMNQQLNRNIIAREYYEKASALEATGNHVEAQKNRDIALNFKEYDISSTLRDFIQDNSADEVSVETVIDLGQGRTALTYVNVTKIGDEEKGGGYKVTYPDNSELNTTLETHDQVLQHITLYTK